MNSLITGQPVGAPPAASNPWAAPDAQVSGALNASSTALGADLGAANTAQENLPGMLAGMQSQISQFTQNSAPAPQATAPYPSFPNSMGLGSQNAYGPSSPVQNTIQGIQGVSPWQFSGEALSR